MTSGASTLKFQLFQDPSRSIIWGSQFDVANSPPVEFDVYLGPRESQTFPVTLYGRVLSGQTEVIPGSYSKSFPGNNNARATVNAPLSPQAPGECNTNPTGSLYFPFTVSANVVKKCTVSASPLDFGTNPGLLNTAVNASTTLAVQCSNTTPYNVGLDAGQNGGGDIGARKMVRGGNSVGYQLYRDTGRTQVWGNTIGTNTVAGTGNGNTQSLTVYGTVPPQTTPPAGTYNDVVIVTVTY